MKRLEPHVLRLLELTAAIVIPLTFLLFVRVYVLCPDGEYDSDSFYHAAMAEFGPEFFAAKEFPNVTLSVWQERFSDKELGFHLLLWGMFRVNDWLGFGNAPPFHLPSLVYVRCCLRRSHCCCTASGSGICGVGRCFW